MKKLILSLLFFPIFAAAEVVEVDKPVICTPVELMLTEISSKYKESAVWIGRKQQSQYVLAINTETTTWSLIEFNDRIACLIDAGVGSQIRLPKTK
jgi:hypothetical protein